MSLQYIKNNRTKKISKIPMQDRNIMNHKQKYIVYVAVGKPQTSKTETFEQEYTNKYSKSIFK